MSRAAAICLDANATSPMHPEAWRAYARGLRALADGLATAPQARAYLLARAQRRIASALGAPGYEVVLTAGGSEANALALGALRTEGTAQSALVLGGAEHPSVAAGGADVAYRSERTLIGLPVDHTGRNAVDVALLPDGPLLVSLMTASNETGVLQPVAEWSRQIAHRPEVWLHTDAVQAVGRIPVHVAASGVHMLSLAGHKVGAGGSLGALLVRPGLPWRPPAWAGARREGRGGWALPGGDNLPGAWALVAALEAHATAAAVAGPAVQVRAQRDAFETELARVCAPIEVLGHGAPRLPNTSCVRFVGCDAQALLVALDVAGFGVSLGSACSSGVSAASPHLRHFGLSPQAGREVVRFSWPMQGDVDAGQALACALAPMVRALRAA